MTVAARLRVVEGRGWAERPPWPVPPAPLAGSTLLEHPGVSNRYHRFPLPGLPELHFVQRIATNRAMSRFFASHRHETIEITYLERGWLEWCTEEGTREISGGEVIVSHPGELHGFANGILSPCTLHTVQVDVEEPRQEGRTYLGLPPSEARMLVEALRTLQARHVTAGSDLAGRYHRLLDCLDQRGHLATLRARALLLELLLAVVDASSRAAGERERSELVQRAVDLIEARLREPLEVSDLARTLGCSVSHLATRFRRETGIPPAQYHLRRRIREASRALAGAGSITAVAFDFGFASSQHFTTAFRRVTGMAPRDYRLTLAEGVAPRPGLVLAGS